MRITTTFEIAIGALRANIARSLLTILGIVIGIMAIVLVVSLGQGAQKLILSEFQSIGADAVILRPGRQPSSPTDITDTLFSDSIKTKDIQALERKSNVPNATAVYPAVLISGAASYQNNIYRPMTFGWTTSAMEDIFHIEPGEGRYFTQSEIDDKAKVVVIGTKVRDKLFGNSDPIGKMIKIKGTNLRVIGVFPPKGQVAVFNVDDVALMPYSTGQQLLGIDYFFEIFIKADNDQNVPFVVQDVKATMREQHGITDPSKDDFFVVTQQNAVKSISTVTNVLTIFLVAIASIALVVGGIGIMNIMLVAVTERTKEVGLRKAVGATNQNILTQFLVEAIVLTSLGGIIGTSLALAIAAVAAYVIRTQYGLAWEFQFPLGAIILGVGVATTIGIVFGLYPARKAATKDPIDALRYE